MSIVSLERFSSSSVVSNPPKRKHSATRLSIAHRDDSAWELVHPRCALQRRDDLEEVEKMIAAEEYEIARDELLWLLEDCRDCLGAHKLLGDLALAESDYRLGRGHYGYVYQSVQKVLSQVPGVTSLPYRLPANQVFYQSGRGLLMCLEKLGKRGQMRDVVARLLELEPRDPLNLRALCPAGPPAKRNFRHKRRRRK